MPGAVPAALAAAMRWRNLAKVLCRLLCRLLSWRGLAKVLCMHSAVGSRGCCEGAAQNGMKSGKRLRGAVQAAVQECSGKFCAGC